MGFKKYLFNTKEKINITITTRKAVLIIKLFLSFIAVLISFAFSEIAKKPTFSPFKFTFFIVVKRN